MGWWLISGHRVRISGGLSASGSGCQVGDWVTVHAERQRDGSPEALALEDLGVGGLDTEKILPSSQTISSASSNGAAVEFEGRVRQLGDGGVIGKWLVDEMRVLVGEGTKILGAPALGTDVEASGSGEGERLPRAKEITVVGPEQKPLLGYGLITDAPAGTGVGVLTLSARNRKGIELPVKGRVDDRAFFDESRCRADVDMRTEVREVPRRMALSERSASRSYGHDHMSDVVD